MKFRLCSLAVVTVIVSGLMVNRPAEAAGPLEGKWRFDISLIAGSTSVPFSPSNNVFTITQSQTDGVFQGQNSPQTGTPLCSFNGEQEGVFLSGTEVCGSPRNSFGAFRGLAIGWLSPTIYMIWADSKGVYFLSAVKTF